MIVTGLVVGLVLGVVLQRGRFCVTGMLRDIFLQKSWRTFTALLVVISVHAVGLTALASAGVISPEYPAFAPAAVVVGAFVFGLGIILAGGCASGTWYRAGEGLVGSWLALGMYALSAAAMKKGALGGLTDWMKSWKTGLTTLPAAVHLSPWVFVVVLTAVTAVLVRHFLAQEKVLVRPRPATNRPWWKRPLGFYTAGALVGLIGVVAWPLSAAAGRNDGLGITSPSSNLVKYVVTGNSTNLDWGVLLVLGLLVGAFLAALATGEFRVRVPDGKTAVRSVVGGVMMGVGASLASGCTVGNGMVQTSLFTFQGWVALVFMALGVGLGARLWIKPGRAGRPAPATGTYSTEQSVVQDFGPSGQSTRATTDVTSRGSDADPDLDGGPGSGDALAGPRPGSGTEREPEKVLVGAGVGAASAAGTAQEAFFPGGAGGSAFGGFSAAPRAVVLERSEVSTKARPLGNGYYALDSLGLVCPFPLVEAKDVMATLASGDHLVIDFDCTQATEAIPHWAAVDGHEVTDFRETGSASWQITMKKG